MLEKRILQWCLTTYMCRQYILSCMGSPQQFHQTCVYNHHPTQCNLGVLCSICSGPMVWWRWWGACHSPWWERSGSHSRHRRLFSSFLLVLTLPDGMVMLYDESLSCSGCWGPVGQRYVHYMRKTDEVDGERLKNLKSKKIRKVLQWLFNDG